MVFSDTRDYNLEVLRGNVAGHSMVIINGHNGDSTTTNTTISPTLTTANIDQSGLQTTPATVDLASTSAADDKDSTGVLTVLVVGLDSGGNAQTEIVTLEGQAEQTTTALWSAINGFVALTWGSGGTNAGTLWCGNGTFTSGVPDTKYASAEIGANAAMTAVYTVPTGNSLFIRQLNFWVVANKDVQFFIQKSTNGMANWVTAAIIGQGQGVSNSDVIGIPEFAAGTNIRICALSSASGTELTAIFGCELISDTTIQ